MVQKDGHWGKGQGNAGSTLPKCIVGKSDVVASFRSASGWTIDETILQFSCPDVTASEMLENLAEQG